MSLKQHREASPVEDPGALAEAGVVVAVGYHEYWTMDPVQRLAEEDQGEVRAVYPEAGPGDVPEEVSVEVPMAVPVGDPVEVQAEVQADPSEVLVASASLSFLCGPTCLVSCCSY